MGVFYNHPISTYAPQYKMLTLLYPALSPSIPKIFSSHPSFWSQNFLPCKLYSTLCIILLLHSLPCFLCPCHQPTAEIPVSIHPLPPLKHEFPEGSSLQGSGFQAINMWGCLRWTFCMQCQHSHLVLTSLLLPPALGRLYHPSSTAWSFGVLHMVTAVSTAHVRSGLLTQGFLWFLWYSVVIKA